MHPFFLHTHTWIHAGHKSFVGFFYMDYCYNSAVVHVFIGNLVQFIVPGFKNKFIYRERGSLDPEKTVEILEFANIDPPTAESAETQATSKQLV